MLKIEMGIENTRKRSVTYVYFCISIGNNSSNFADKPKKANWGNVSEIQRIH